MGSSLGSANRHGRTFLLRASATVLSEEGNKIVHRLEPRGIDHRTAVAADGDQSGKAQPVKMKGERVGRETEFFSDLASRHALRAGLHQQTEDFQAVVLGKRAQ